MFTLNNFEYVVSTATARCQISDNEREEDEILEREKKEKTPKKTKKAEKANLALLNSNYRQQDTSDSDDNIGRVRV